SQASRPWRNTLDVSVVPGTALLAFALWATGVTLMLLRLALQGLRLYSLARRAPTATNLAVRHAADNAALRSQYRGRLHLIAAAPHSAISVPVTWGVWQPVILVP